MTYHPRMRRRTVKLLAAWFAVSIPAAIAVGKFIGFGGG